MSKLTTILFLILCLLLPNTIRAQEDSSQRVTSIELSAGARRAIDRALAYLQNQQRPDGSWGRDRYWVANTSLCVIAYMVQGHVPGKGKYGETIERGIDYLVKQARQRPDGYIVDSSETFYQHALAVMALSEAWGQSKNPDIAEAVRKGANVILRCQGNEGGWRYDPRPTRGDLSVTIMAVEALVSAKEAGVLVPDESLKKAREFIYACQNPQDGSFGYLPNQPDETNSYRMGAGLLGLQLLGDLDSEKLKKGWGFLMKEGVQQEWAFKMRGDWLGQFYCVQACYQAGDDRIRFWYPKASERIIAAQKANGQIGGDGNLPHGSTAVATLILAVPYRYLPIFQR